MPAFDPIRKMLLSALLLALLVPAAAPPGHAQIGPDAPAAETSGAAQGEVLVEPRAGDSAIEARLRRILQASEWFRDPAVRVSEGIVFLDGVTQTEERREWAGRVARTTQDVVAVVNRIEVRPAAEWDFTPAWEEVRLLALKGQRALPLLVLALLVLAVTWLAGRLVAGAARWAFGQRITTPLLLTIVARAFAIPVVLIGLYLVLQFAGLTRLAVTLLGGTGLVGLVIGFAFRDIAENFLASLLLSVRNPFKMGDLVKIGGETGIVRNLNMRMTLLFTLDGNHVQIPNATVYKSVITNFTSSASRRTDFVIGIGYDAQTSEAQSIISGVLAAHPAVKAEPMPLVLVDELGSATVNLRVYFWFDGKTYSPIKLRSAVMRQIKEALLMRGISMPDESREVIFPQGLPVYRMDRPETAGATRPHAPAREARPTPAVAVEGEHSAAEGGLANEDILREEEASTEPEAEENLLARE
ncbi:mechanosensitive ion channel domain-containing protein [Afifella sp. IM 167]|uniref:mechanosensitive ion channel domain-containing protein n=1 Tax=Afifella sp. IM 167 TaxID=2033586 RepID=UPI001CCE7BF0|nr:mechanosensitive ion channel domain-containing protein [Afifella sp. IM 167]